MEDTELPLTAHLLTLALLWFYWGRGRSLLEREADNRACRPFLLIRVSVVSLAARLRTGTRPLLSRPDFVCLIPCAGGMLAAVTPRP